MGANEVTITPDYHAPRTNDGGMTSGVRCAEGSRSLMGTTGATSTVQRRRTGVAGGTKYTNVTPYCKVSPKTIRPLSHHQSLGTGHIPTPTSRTVDHPPCVPCGSPDAV